MTITPAVRAVFHTTLDTSSLHTAHCCLEPGLSHIITTGVHGDGLAIPPMEMVLAVNFVAIFLLVNFNTFFIWLGHCFLFWILFDGPHLPFFVQTFHNSVVVLKACCVDITRVGSPEFDVVAKK